MGSSERWGCARKKRPVSDWDEFMAQYGVELDVAPEVCIIHRAFVPCRHGKQHLDCVFSSDPNDVAAVRDYQQGE